MVKTKSAGKVSAEKARQMIAEYRRQGLDVVTRFDNKDRKFLTVEDRQGRQIDRIY